jgi:hypothetical protein
MANLVSAQKLPLHQYRQIKSIFGCVRSSTPSSICELIIAFISLWVFTYLFEEQLDFYFANKEWLLLESVEATVIPQICTLSTYKHLITCLEVELL